MKTPQEQGISDWERQMRDINLEIGEKELRLSFVKDGDQLALQCFQLADTLGITQLMVEMNSVLLRGAADHPGSLDFFVGDDSDGHIVRYELFWLEDERLLGGSIRAEVEILEEEGTLRVGRIFVGDQLLPSPALSVIQDALLREFRIQVQL